MRPVYLFAAIVAALLMSCTPPEVYNPDANDYNNRENIEIQKTN